MSPEILILSAFLQLLVLTIALGLWVIGLKARNRWLAKENRKLMEAYELVKETAFAHTTDEAWQASERCYDWFDVNRRGDDRR